MVEVCTVFCYCLLYLETIDVCIRRMFVFYFCCSDCVVVCGKVCCVAAVVKYSGCCVFCLYCEAWSCMCSCMGSVSVSSCRCCMCVSCVHPVAVVNAAFCITYSLLILVEDARGDHMEETYSRAGPRTAL